MRIIFTLLFIIVYCLNAEAQIAPENLEKLKRYEDSLALLSEQARSGFTEQERVVANYAIIPLLVEALKVEGSFDYPFSKLGGISIVTPEDRAFRIFTWQLLFATETYRHFGAIQMNSKKLKLFPLIDLSDSLTNLKDTVLTSDAWYGALYYNILVTKKGRSKYYTLFGFDSNDYFSRRKLIEILHFNKDGEPVFGAPVIHLADGSIQKRFILEYQKNAAVTLNYLKERGLIVYDHLVARETVSQDLAFTYIPDGTYEGFELKKGEWYHVDKVFHEAINEFDNPPVPVPKKKDPKDSMMQPSRKP